MNPSENVEEILDTSGWYREEARDVGELTELEVLELLAKEFVDAP